MLTANIKLARDLSVAFLPLEPNGTPHYLDKREIGANKSSPTKRIFTLAIGPHFPAFNIEIGDGKQKTTRKQNFFVAVGGGSNSFSAKRRF